MTDNLSRHVPRGSVALGPPRSLEGGRLTRQDFRFPGGTATVTRTNWEKPRGVRKAHSDDVWDDEDEDEDDDDDENEEGLRSHRADDPYRPLKWMGGIFLFFYILVKMFTR